MVVLASDYRGGGGMVQWLLLLGGIEEGWECLEVVTILVQHCL